MLILLEGGRALHRQVNDSLRCGWRQSCLTRDEAARRLGHWVLRGMCLFQVILVELNTLRSLLHIDELLLSLLL